jgi:hypothetical protein
LSWPPVVIKKNNFIIAELLVSEGASLSIKNNQELSPLALVTKLNDNELKQELIKLNQEFQQKQAKGDPVKAENIKLRSALIIAISEYMDI